jgi:putative ABC transport system permease protein
MHTLMQDLRYGVRMLVRSTGFSLVAVLTIALGIGANTAIFSVVNALLIRPLPYPQPDRLVMVYQDLRARGGPATEWATPGNFVDWGGSGLFNALAAVQGWQPTLTGMGDAEPLVGEQVTRQYFEVLGVAPALGRAFRQEEDIPNGPRVVVLSHALWQRRFGGDPAAVGRTMILGGETHEVIGVMPAGFRPAVISTAEAWRPRRLAVANPSRGAVVLRIVARLRPDLTLRQAQSSADLLAKQLAVSHPDFNVDTGINLVTLREQVVGNIERSLLVLLGAVAFVLLIACANIANLLLARASGRAREMAVRMALGARRRRVVRQLLTESVLLSAIGGGLGLLLGAWGVDALVALAPAGAPRVDEIGLDATVLAFAIGLTLLTGVTFGVVPALHSSRAEVTPGLKDGGKGMTGNSGHQVRRALIVLEVAIALVLLIGSGLLLRTFLRLQAFDLGFDPSRVLVGAVLPPRVAYQTAEQQSAFYDRLLARVSALPGVETASLSSIVPLGGDSDMTILIEGRPLPRTDAETTAIWYRLISAGYFKVMSIPIVEGRGFDTREAAPSAIVSDVAARRLWPGESPLGRRVRFSPEADAPWFTVVGIAGEVKMRGARGESRSEIYLPYWQFTELGTNVVLKAAGSPGHLIGTLRQAVREVDPNVPVSSVAPMSELVADSIGAPRFFALLTGVFAVLALALAAVGIYGVMAYAVALRTPEIGVRMALGAGRRDVFALIVGDGLRLAAIGIGTGLVASALMSLSIRSLLFGVTPADPLTFAGMTALLLMAAAVACIVPAHRAARVDPMVALRAE